MMSPIYSLLKIKYHVKINHKKIDNTSKLKIFGSIILKINKRCKRKKCKGY